VVPPCSDPEDAHETMMAAAGRTNTSTVNDLLTIRSRQAGHRM
jgi:hypothetical protein